MSKNYDISEWMDTRPLGNVDVDVIWLKYL